MTKAKHLDCIVEDSMLNGLQKNFKHAIEYAGAKVSKSDCLWQYPEIIKNNLVAKSINNINLLGQDIINITRVPDDTEIVYNISTIYDTTDVKRPIYASHSTIWDDAMTVDDVFKDMFKNILPAVRGVHAGDITSSDENGNDVTEWNNTLFNKKGNKTGLTPDSKYLRLYLTCQDEPLYIFINGIVNDVTEGYNIKDSDTVHLNIDANNTLTAHISCISVEQINAID